MIFGILVCLLVFLFLLVIMFSTVNRFLTGEFDISMTEKFCIAVFAFSASTSVVLIFRQALQKASVIILIFCMLVSVICGIGLMFGAKVLHVFFPDLSDIHESNFITVSMISSAFCLMLWTRIKRITTDSDGIINAMKSMKYLWPMVPLYALVIFFEFVISSGLDFYQTLLP